MKEVKKKGVDARLNQTMILNSINKCPSIGKHIEAFLATGNIMSKSSLGLMQVCVKSNSVGHVIAKYLMIFRHDFQCNLVERNIIFFIQSENKIY